RGSEDGRGGGRLHLRRTARSARVQPAVEDRGALRDGGAQAVQGAPQPAGGGAASGPERRGGQMPRRRPRGGVRRSGARGRGPGAKRLRGGDRKEYEQADRRVARVARVRRWSRLSEQGTA